jgi:DNA-binding NarL/FixJ family response regulator
MAKSESEPEESEVAGGGAIVVVDPDLASRNQAEDLEDDLDRQVIAMDSMEFDMESSGEVLDAGVYIISWDLGIRSGADLVEELREDVRTADKTILIATDSPTKELVIWAMAAGADGVCLKPYDGEEIGRRIAAADGARKAA